MISSDTGSRHNAGHPKDLPDEYTGYQPFCAQDLPFDEDVWRGGTDVESPKDVILGDQGKSSKSLLLSMLCFGLCFIALLAWQILIARCKVNNLCEILDNSSTIQGGYPYQPMSFRIPTALVWVGLLSGVVGLICAFAGSFAILRMPVGTAKMSEIATSVRHTLSSLLVLQYVTLFFPAIAIFILLGIGINWRMAGSWFIGATACTLVAHTASAVSTRAEMRVTAATRTGVHHAEKISFQAGAVVCVATFSTAILLVAGIYLMFADIRALAGFAAGSSSIALFLGMSGDVFSSLSGERRNAVHDFGNTTNTGKDMLYPNAETSRIIGAQLSIIATLGTNLFSSLVCSVIATAMLGSTLPFFFFNSFAMCVYNHLNIDQTCGPFGYPKKLSYATYICRNTNLYLKYPPLSTWASNSAFVAAPFVLASIGALTATVSTICSRTSMRFWKTREPEETSSSDSITTMNRFLRVSRLLSYALIVAGSAGLCFGLFGGSSAFQSGRGMGNNDNLLTMELDDTSEQCITRYFDAEIDGGLTPLPVPQGGIENFRRYRPLDAMGLNFGNADSTAWRLFICVIVGVSLAAMISEVIYPLECKGEANRRHTFSSGIECTTATDATHILGSALLSTVTLTFVYIVAVVSSFKLYGPYGVGFAALGFLCCAGFSCASSVSGVLSCTSGDVNTLSTTRQGTRNNTCLKQVGRTNRGCDGLFVSTGSALCSTAVLLASVQHSGLIPSPGELIGSPEQIPEKFLGTYPVASLTTLPVVLGFMSGIIVPFVTGGFLLFASCESPKEKPCPGNERQANLTVSPRHYARSAVLGAIVPAMGSTLMPLVVGFGLGQRALFSFVSSIIVTAYLLGGFLTSASWKYYNAQSACDRRGVSGKDLRAPSPQISAVSSPTSLNFTGGSIQGLGKVSASIALAVEVLFRPDGSKGWVGGVVLAIAVTLIIAFFLTKYLILSGRSTPAADISEHDNSLRAPPKRVSPFYEDGPTIDPELVLPGSQAYEALQGVGSPLIPVSPRNLPGLSDRSAPEMANRQEILTPRAAKPVAPAVFLDETRVDG